MTEEKNKLTDRFGKVETITPSFTALSLHKSSPRQRNKMNRKSKKYVKVISSKKKKILKLKKRKKLDKQFRNTLNLTRKWDQRLDMLLAKYHMQNFADGPKGNRTTF